MKMNKSIVTGALAMLVMLASGPRQAEATAQEADVLLIDGERHALFSNPLEQYFAHSGRPRPAFKWQHTANWRGYVAEWEIAGGMLYLMGVRGHTAQGEVHLGDLFPGNTGRIAAVWFSGELRVPQGKLVQYVHMGYESVYEHELFVTIERGKVTERKPFKRNCEMAGPRGCADERAR